MSIVLVNGVNKEAVLGFVQFPSCQFDLLNYTVTLYVMGRIIETVFLIEFYYKMATLMLNKSKSNLMVTQPK